ncbi:LiaF domain-containing protein [Sporosalibacterium faouarense]|uniref:LiaF domain-containing protein n=1 Tax=Sporosalibacterium faouarense TaxID=516123 RepID=UPI00141CD792|nr:LiaF domain-containing protein [Sporosalibacterium faouarense]MTI47561.1 hypothetical protein [Bacillota bacterium]
MRFSGSFTLGILFVIFGILFILKNIVNINIPVARIIVGVLIIIFGLNVLFGGSISRKDSDLIFQSGNINYQANVDEYNVIFGNGTIDLSNIDIDNSNKKIEINTIFGQTRLILKSDTPINMKSNTVFGTTRTPDLDSNFFGESKYSQEGNDSEQPKLIIETNTIFGQTRVVSE